LGVSSKKRHELAQFRDRFRAFRLSAGPSIEKVGKSAYRLKAAEAPEAVEAAEAAENLVELEVIAVADDAPEALDVTAIELDVTASELAPEVAMPVVLEAAVTASAEQTEPAVRDTYSMLEHPVALEEADLGFGEPMVASAADSGELAANHVIFSAWPESMQPEAATEPAPIELEIEVEARTEAQIEAEVRELVGGSEFVDRRQGPESLIAQAEQAVVRTWRDGGHWLGRRFAELFSRN